MSPYLYIMNVACGMAVTVRNILHGTSGCRSNLILLIQTIYTTEPKNCQSQKGNNTQIRVFSTKSINIFCDRAYGRTIQKKPKVCKIIQIMCYSIVYVLNL